MGNRPVLLTLILLGASALFAASAQATQDPLDTTFGSAGKVTTSFSTGVDGAGALAIQPDGKIIAVGSARTESEFALARYNPDGSLDTSFGSGGTVAASYGLGNSYANAVALQPDGKIIAAGTSYNGASGNDFTLVRYNPNGTLDTTFGANGVVATDFFGHDDFATGVALQPDGKIVAAGTAKTETGSEFALVRYNPNGSIDTSFGTNGKVTTSFATGDGVADALALQPDGKIVVVGEVKSIPGSLFALARYDTDGSLDSTFGSNGEVTSAFGSGSDTNAARAVALQSDGKIVVAGVAENSAALARYDTNGSLDATFGAGGLVVSSEVSAAGVSVEPDGKIVTAGQDFNDTGTSEEFALTRYNSDGSPDDSFGQDGNGEERTSFGVSDASARAIALQPDGRIVLAGTTTVTPGSDYDFALARYLGSTLSVTKGGSGTGTVSSTPAGIHCGPSCSAPFAPTSVTLTATPSARSTFGGWSGDCSGREACTLTMNTDHYVKANFNPLCIVPNVKGKKLTQSKRTLRQAHCGVGRISKARSKKVTTGRVISEKPAKGTKLPAGSKVRLTVSSGFPAK